MRRRNQTKNFVLLSIFVALILLLTFVPGIGYIPIGPAVSLSIIHIPVLIAAIVLPPVYGLVAGASFGLSSMIVAIIRPNTILDPVFRNPLVSVLPRILFAGAAILIYWLFKKLDQKTSKSWIIQFSLTGAFILGFLFLGLNTLLNNIMETSFSWYYILLICIGVTTLLMIAFYFQIKRNKRASRIPVTFLMATVIHTALVMLMLYAFGSTELGIAAGETTTIGNIIFTTVAANGTIEALLAVVVGTPIVMAITRAFPELE